MILTAICCHPSLTSLQRNNTRQLLNSIQQSVAILDDLFVPNCSVTTTDQKARENKNPQRVVRVHPDRLDDSLHCVDLARQAPAIRERCPALSIPLPPGRAGISF